MTAARASGPVVLSLALACCGHPPPTIPTGAADSIDVLDFLIGNPLTWPRLGSHSQNQFVDMDRREICWVKYANPGTFECWRWDGEFVYHAVDHAIDGNTGESYRFTDGRWLPRHFGGSWSVDVGGNLVTWFEASCAVEPAKSHLFPYRQRAWIEPARDAGPDIGVRETLVLEYQPYDPGGGVAEAELFYFARGAGWYEWDRGQVRDLFNRVGGPAPSPRLDTVCGGS